MKWIKNNGVFILIFLLCAYFSPNMVFILIGLYAFYHSAKDVKTITMIEKKGIRVFGEIKHYTRDGDGYQIPTIIFTTHNGETIEKEPAVFSASDLNKFENFKGSVGKKVRVKYNPEEPEKFVIDGESNLGCIIFVILISLLFFGLGVADLLGFINMRAD